MSITGKIVSPVVPNPPHGAQGFYVHRDMKTGEENTVFIEDDGTRFYFARTASGERKFYLPSLPNEVHGRYYWDQIKNGFKSRAEYIRFHTDWMLP